ncbi:MAG: VWA domain-containing protein [Myxococcales bacterium]|nr:VWA domain-containing protein [Myxococcales bacterium]
MVAFALGVIAAPATAKAETWGQYLVVIDDSGSMDGSDPRRLVVMAATAMAAALEDGDQIAVVGLNELANGELPRFVSPGDLLAGRGGAEGAKTLSGERFDRLAQHRGGTPCRAALAKAQTLLEGAASAGAPQTLLLLTDGACNGGAVEKADRWLGELRAHTEGRFRFVLLTRAGRERVEPELLRYASATGWAGESRIAFDARALLRAFAEVLSFSRGLSYDDGGRVGLERTFAGARKVRVLAIAEEGAATIDLAKVTSGEEAAIAGGPTFSHGEHGWSLRSAELGPADAPYAVKAKTAGVDVLVIPSYGALQVEAVIAPCEPRPALPWTRESPVRAGQPHCAWARLVGDTGETIVPGRSFAFDLELCEDEACARASAMQPDADGTFNAQLGAAPERGRHERTFRAKGGALARPVSTRRAFQAMSFGVEGLRRAGTDDPYITSLDLGALPKATIETISLEGRGAFPAAAEAAVSCAVDGDAAIRECLVCRPSAPTIALQDPLSVQLEVGATPFCPAISDHGGQPLEARMRLEIKPQGDAAASLGPTVVPITATLNYAKNEARALSLMGGGEGTQDVLVPAPIAGAVSMTVEAAAGGALPEDLEVAPAATSTRLQASDAGTDRVTLTLRAGDCCKPQTYAAVLRLAAEAGGPTLAVPLEITVQDPGFWVCPGKKILRWTLIALGVLTLLWIIRGFLSPARFPAGVVLAYAESHEALAKLGEGDEGWLRIERFPETKRGFYRPGTLYLGGAAAPLPSLKRMAPSARIEARPGGAAVLIVEGDGTETFSESRGWTPIEPGEHPVHSRIVLRREGSLYLLFRR